MNGQKQAYKKILNNEKKTIEAAIQAINKNKVIQKNAKKNTKSK